ncbi:MAG: DNA/RNA nuclease SfsA [Oscillospiraceae bacterium]|nr:DNA/RNA nuclease SfsA [Oscillospiraceae bacterium]
MKYDNTVSGIFISRPNRFIAHVNINGEVHVCHVKNTGRCRELLTEGATVYLQKASNPSRKTGYDLIAVQKGDLLINMDSAAPNKAAAEYLRKHFGDKALIKPEKTYGASRIDFYVETAAEKWLIEVKGVTLEEQGRALFPDAPTQRGVKHINELIKATKEGYKTCILFIIQMKGITSFSPNDATHPAFGEALRQAAKQGVQIKAIDCIVTPDAMTPDKEVPIKLK